MAAPMEVNVCRKKLADHVGPDNMALYMQILKSWFKMKNNEDSVVMISKEEFDTEARKLLKADSMHLHNEFLLCIIAKCQTVVSLVPRDLAQHSLLAPHTKFPKKSGSSKLKRKHPGSRSNIQKFTPLSPLHYAPAVSPRPVEEGGGFLTFVSRECLLPDIGMIKGRMLVCAWETGLQDVQDTAVRMIVKAVETQLKTILDIALSHMTAYKVREGKFRYAHGCERPNPYLRQAHNIEDSTQAGEATGLSATGSHIPSFKSTWDMAEQSALQQMMASGSQPPRKHPLTLFQLLDALQLYRNSVPSHSVYAPLVERVFQKMWHPSNEEYNQESIATQEAVLKQELSI